MDLYLTKTANKYNIFHGMDDWEHLKISSLFQLPRLGFTSRLFLKVETDGNDNSMTWTSFWANTFQELSSYLYIFWEAIRVIWSNYLIL